MYMQVTSLSGRGDDSKSSTGGMSFGSLNFSNYCCFLRELTFSFNLGSLTPENPVQVSTDQLTAAVYDLLRLHANSSRSSCTPSSRNIKEAWSTTEQLQFTVFAAHGISSNWVSK
jgi:hypothetical protein